MKLLNLDETAAMTRVPAATLRYYRHAGTGPQSFKLGRRVMYREEDVQAWMQAAYEADHRDPEPAA